MDTSELTALSKNLDHHGLVAAVFKDLGIIEKIHARIPNRDPRRIVSTGHAVLAMVINGLGFTNRRLYLSPQFFQDKPVDLLIDPEIEAVNIDDHALGKALDEIAEYGATRLFGEIAMEIGIEQNLLREIANLDSTSLSVEGEYSSAWKNDSAISVTHGYSKDHRPDLKQVMLALCTSGPSDFPFWMEPQNGNASDKAEFPKIIERVRKFKAQLKKCPDFTWIGDSALYSERGLLSQNNFLWITRVPETITESKQLIERSDDQIQWKTTEKANSAGYKYASFSSHYGGVEQRWLLVFSQQAFEREKKTFEKNLSKKTAALEKELWHLSNQQFGCEADIEKKIEEIRKRHPLHTITYSTEAILKNPKRGRPALNQKKVHKGFSLQAKLELNESAISGKLNSKGRFILATNNLDHENLQDDQILADYKSQQGVERGFRFLKDPWFMVDSIFLKSPKRIEALMMVMALCLLVYNVAQFRLREKLRETNSKIPNQLNKPVQNPTLRWIFQIMEGISQVTFLIKDQIIKHCVTNLTQLRLSIIRLFGPAAMRIYSVS